MLLLSTAKHFILFLYIFLYPYQDNSSILKFGTLVEVHYYHFTYLVCSCPIHLSNLFCIYTNFFIFINITALFKMMSTLLEVHYYHFIYLVCSRYVHLGTLFCIYTYFLILSKCKTFELLATFF